ncbi:hypothetical protein R1sor_003443 [Riccia sorocarpa]|uniref:ZZ-type domain-containing protein n=1 Tax=Riccia sorocarpa TaxID=122646 RepID=A0ABD3H5Q3_9MARC
MEAYTSVPFSAELEDGVAQLQRYLLHVKELKKQRTILVEEVRTFAEALDENLLFLKTNLPPTDSKKALGSLGNEVKGANAFMAEALGRGKFTGVWTDREVRSHLESRRQKLVSAFQLAFMTTSLDVMFDRCRKVDNFHERINELYSVHISDVPAARTQIQDLLQPLVAGISVQDEKQQNLISHVKNELHMIVKRNYRFSTTESIYIQEFFVDVLAAVEQQQNEYQLEEMMCDAFYTEDLMWDPVKATDGFTYDRWTIVQNDDHPDHRSLPDGLSPFTRAPLSILCDDVTVRQRLFSTEKFRKENIEKKCKEMQEKYRTKTLELVMDNQDGEALERLEHVLQWAPEDEVCRKHQAAISLRLGKPQASPTKPIEESVRALIEDLQSQAKLDETKIQLLERKSNELEASLSEAKEEVERKGVLLEQRSRFQSEFKEEERCLLERNTDLEVRLSEEKEEAASRIQFLERKSSELEARLSEAKKEVERKGVLLNQRSQRQSELKQEKRSLMERNTDLEARLSEAKEQAAASSALMEEEFKRYQEEVQTLQKVIEATQGVDLDREKLRLLERNADLEERLIEADKKAAAKFNDETLPQDSTRVQGPVRKSVHHGVACDGCGKSPIVGVRYKSTVKEDYDLCSSCHAKAGAPAGEYIIFNNPPFRGRHFQNGRMVNGSSCFQPRPYQEYIQTLQKKREATKIASGPPPVPSNEMEEEEFPFSHFGRSESEDEGFPKRLAVPSNEEEEESALLRFPHPTPQTNVVPANTRKGFRVSKKKSSLAILFDQA